jgi:hypothetical protein
MVEHRDPSLLSSDQAAMPVERLALYRATHPD